MTNATKPFSNRLAIVFDFDETLASDTFALLLEDLGLDVDTFKQQRVQPLLDDGWDKYIARAYCLVEESKQRADNDKITQARLARVGRELKPFEGVPEMFDRLRQCAQDLVEDVEVEFYLISGGFIEMALNTSIASNFKAMWGCRFHYGEDGEIKFIKQQMTNTEKTSYLYYLSKGMDIEKEKDLMFAYSSVPDNELRIPLTQVIYVGDGASDAPCFAVLNQNNGIGIGLYKAGHSQQWSQQDKIDVNQRVANIAPPDYKGNSELMQSLTLAVERICKQIALRRLSIGE
ncbi:HAD family hydrolase [Pleurocapsales cyanobacterium LEGE 10410]|nr:HAD family hydrolase [Pleurocapsales cyanobacterium LEGE 10410]